MLVVVEETNENQVKRELVALVLILEVVLLERKLVALELEVVTLNKLEGVRRRLVV